MLQFLGPILFRHSFVHSYTDASSFFTLEEGDRQVDKNHGEFVNNDSRTKSWIFYEWKNGPRSPENQVPACRGVQVTMGRHKRAKRRANSARDLAQSGRVSAHLAIESGVPCRCSLRATYGRGHSLFTAWRSNSDLNALKIMHRLEGLSWELLTVTLDIFVFWIPRVSWRFLETPHSFRVTLSAFKRMKLIYWFKTNAMIQRMIIT